MRWHCQTPRVRGPYRARMYAVDLVRWLRQHMDCVLGLVRLHRIKRSLKDLRYNW